MDDHKISRDNKIVKKGEVSHKTVLNKHWVRWEKSR